jgi:hypothetical protein
MRSVNEELVLLYWEVGREILQRQEREGWGAKVIDRLAGDLRAAFPVSSCRTAAGDHTQRMAALERIANAMESASRTRLISCRRRLGLTFGCPLL